MKFPVRKSRFTDIVPVDDEIDVDEPTPRPDPLIIHPDDDPQEGIGCAAWVVAWASVVIVTASIYICWGLIAAAIHYIGG